MNHSETNPYTVVLGSIAAVLLVPPVVYFLTGLTNAMTFIETFTALIAQYSGRPNLLVTGLIGLIPLGAIGLVLWIHRRTGGKALTRRYLFRASMLALIAVLVWSNHEFWRVFLPQRIYPGFPHGLELFIGPVFFAPVAILLAMLIAWVLQRSRS